MAVHLLTHRPKGRMCLNCADARSDCSNLKFHEMPEIGKGWDGMIEVRCTRFKQKKARPVCGCKYL